MAQTNYTPISLYYSTTASAVPTAANLVPGELAINTNDGKLYYEDSSGVVQVLATKSTGSIGGSNTQVQFNNSGSLGGSSSFTWDGTTVTATKFAGALNGTVGATTASTGAFTTLTSNGATTFTAGTASTSTTTGTTVITGGLGVSGRINAANFDGIVGANTAAAGSFTTINASTSITNAGLTSGRVTFAGTAGLLQDSGNLTWNGTTFAITGGESVTGVLNLSGNNQMHQLSGHNFVQGDANTTYLYGGANGGQIRTANNGSILWDWSDAGLFNWYASGGIKMTLLASGNLGIGTSSPSYKLDVNGTLGVSGVLTSTVTSALITNAISGDTNAIYHHVKNTGGEVYIGLNNNSNAGLITGGGNYATCILNPSATNIAFATNGTLAMTLDASGNLGLGTSSPSSRLSVTGSANIATFDGGSTTSITLTGSSRSDLFLIDSGAATDQKRLTIRGDDGNLIFGVENDAVTTFTERMRIDSSGQLLVGTSSNTTNGGFVFATDFYGAGRSTQIIGHINGASSGDAYMIFNYNGTGIGSITQTGTTGVLYNVTSDQRLKTNVVDAPSGNIDDIKVRSFDWIADGSHQEYGMVAQELITVAPYAVHQPKDSEEMMGVDYSKLVPMMIKEIQDLKQRIATLENK